MQQDVEVYNPGTVPALPRDETGSSRQASQSPVPVSQAQEMVTGLGELVSWVGFVLSWSGRFPHVRLKGRKNVRGRCLEIAFVLWLVQRSERVWY
jgi:hypothetical protein